MQIDPAELKVLQRLVNLELNDEEFWESRDGCGDAKRLKVLRSLAAKLRDAERPRDQPAPR